MRELITSDILPIIQNYLSEQGYIKVCKKLEKASGYTNKNLNKFTKTNLKDILQFYLEHKPKLHKLFNSESTDEPIEKEQPVY